MGTDMKTILTLLPLVCYAVAANPGGYNYGEYEQQQYQVDRYDTQPQQYQQDSYDTVPYQPEDRYDTVPYQPVMPHPTSQPSINQQRQCTQHTTRKKRRNILQNLLLTNTEGRMSQEDILPKQRLRMTTELLGVSTVSSCQMVEYRL